MGPVRQLAGPGQESVWDYPRPPRIEPVAKIVRIMFDGRLIVETHRALRVLETSHPPTYYLPVDDIADGVLVPAAGGSLCEWKGRAVVFDVAGASRVARGAAWSYPAPTPSFQAIRDHVAFYAGPMDTCTVGVAIATPQPGGFYGGWITPDVVGPFKGEPGTMHW